MDFLKWLNHFEYIVGFMHIPNNVKVEFLLKLINPISYSHIYRKVAPANPFSLPYEVLISQFEELYGLYQGEWAANYRFIYRNQFIGESVLQYVHALSRIVSKASLFLKSNVSLLVRMMNGLNDNGLKIILRGVTNLPFEKIIVIAAQFELHKILTEPN
ncbi:hypothetical protein M0804_013242 [Polistes exclamans]|nr:hypothetical protein M0804_013242 [Polistes exclamans]